MRVFALARHFGGAPTRGPLFRAVPAGASRAGLRSFSIFPRLDATTGYATQLAEATTESAARLWQYKPEGSMLLPTNLVARLLELTQAYSGLTWPLTIVAFTIGVRLMLLPFTIKQTRTAILSNNFKPQLQKMQAEVQSLRAQGQSEASQAKLREVTQFMTSKGINPLKLLGLSLVPVPIFMSCFFALRNMAQASIEGFKGGEFFWIPDVAASDPFYILPAIATGALLASFEVLGGSARARADRSAILTCVW